MIEQLDLDAPYVPKGAYVPQLGDKARFVVGERMDATCISCGAISPMPWDSILRMSGKVFTIDHIRGASGPCLPCGVEDAYPDAETYKYRLNSDAFEFCGWACANELTLIEKGNDNA